MSNLNLKPLTDKLTSIPATLVESSSSSSGREVEVGQVQAGADFNPIDIETPLALEEREVSPLEEDKISPYFANEELVNIFSYLGKLNKEYLLSICKELREYFFDTKFIIVNFEISKFLKLESEKQSEIINLIQKTDVRLSIIKDMAFKNLTTILSQQPFIFGDAQDSFKKIIQLTLSLLDEGGYGPILDFLNGCKFLETLRFKYIEQNLFFTIPENLSNLIAISFRHIREGAKIRVPKSLNSLKTLSINFYEPSTVTVEEGMPALKALHYENITRHAEGIRRLVKVPQGLPSLETLSFKNLLAGQIFIPGGLPALTSISFGDIYRGTIGKPNIIAIEKVEGGFPALKSISFGYISEKGLGSIVIVIPENLKQHIVNPTPALEALIRWA